MSSVEHTCLYALFVKGLTLPRGNGYHSVFERAAAA